MSPLEAETRRMAKTQQAEKNEVCALANCKVFGTVGV
jgi:hypothetical protein